MEQEEKLSNILAAFADGTLEAARGNSGTIFAQWFQGFMDSAEGMEEINTKQFVPIFAAAAAHAYRAVADPVEGTVLTVLNDSADALTKLKTIPTDFAALFDILMAEANQSLADTPKKLKVLKKFGVVDAGAQAFVDFLEGISRFIHQGNLKNLDAEIAEIVEAELEESCDHDVHDHNIDDYTYRYCTECVIVGEGIEQEKLKQEVRGMGDSLVLAGSKRKTKIHMHVNQPAELFRICRQYGKLLNEKADDMFHQIKDAHAKHSDVAIVTDSAVDLPQAVLDSLNIHVIPIRIHVGDDAFIDRVSITPEEFYDIVETQGILPKTAHPTYRDFKAKYQFLNSHYKSIISIHLSKKMSNTVGAAELVQGEMADVKLSVFDSMSVSAGQGLLVQYAAELANAGHTHQDIIGRLNEASESVQIFAMIGNLLYAVKGGRLSGFAKKIADWFKVTPILHILLNRKIKVAGIIRTKHKVTKQFAKKVLSKMDPEKHYRIGLIHCETPEEGQKLLELMTFNSPNIESSFLVNCGVTIGSHAGPGTLGVSFMEVKK